MTPLVLSHLLPERWPDGRVELLVAGDAWLLQELLTPRLKTIQGTLALSFQGIERLTAGAAERLGPLLHQRFVEGRVAGQFLCYVECPPGVMEALDAAFQVHPSRHRFDHPSVSLAQSNAKQVTVLGHLQPHLKDVLECLYREGSLSAESLTQQSMAAGSKKLSVLYRTCPWLLRRTSTFSGGKWSYLYHPVFHHPEQKTTGPA